MIDLFPSIWRDSCSLLEVCQSLSCHPCEKLLQVHHIDHGVHKKYPCLKLTEKLYIKSKLSVDICFVNDEMMNMIVRFAFVGDLTNLRA